MKSNRFAAPPAAIDSGASPTMGRRMPEGQIVNQIEREMEQRGLVRLAVPGFSSALLVADFAVRGVKLVRRAGATWVPKRMMGSTSFTLRHLLAPDVRSWNKKKVVEYAKGRGLEVTEHMVEGNRGGRQLRVNIGAGTGTSYRSALVDLLGWEESERWRKGATDLGLVPPQRGSERWVKKKVESIF